MIHILIERHIAEGMGSTYDELARLALQRTYVVPGFISGETFTNSNSPNHRFLFCKWRSIEDWLRWQNSYERLALTGKFAPILEQPEKVTQLKN